MAHIPACEVKSPQDKISSVVVLHDTGQEDATSYAALTWEGEPYIGVRTNGTTRKPVGYPNANGQPTWLLLDMEDGVAALAAALARTAIKD